MTSCLASHLREKLTGEVRSSDHPREVVYVPCIPYAHKLYTHSTVFHAKRVECAIFKYLGHTTCYTHI